MDNTVILSTTYLGPVQYFTKFLLGKKVIIEKHDNFIKQTYRNRCLICGANGPLALTVPVLRGSFHKTAVRYLQIDYSRKWQAEHWRAIESAYRSSPFFEYYSEDLKKVYNKQYSLLLQLNTELLETVFRLTGISIDYSFSTEYLSTGTLDHRMAIRPKHPLPDPLFKPAFYHQVFEDRFGFIENLSILDLLFNTGPETASYLERSVVKPK
jgi:hypothetical protein